MLFIDYNRSMNVDRILELDRRAREEVGKYPERRFAFDTLAAHAGRPFAAVFGPRGTGKTVLLRQLRGCAEDSLYISADTLDPGDSIREIVAYFSDSMRIMNFFIDEIHFAKKYAADLKEIYDFYSVNIWYTSSVSLSLHSSAWDLSRRVISYYLYPFSFREYLAFKFDIRIAPLSLENALMQRVQPEYLKAGPYFNDYLAGGLYPFLLQPGASIRQFDTIIKKILSSDIPNYDPQLTMEDLFLIEKTLAFIGRSPVDGINFSSVSENVGVTKYKAEKYLNILEKTFLLSLVFPKGTNVRKEPKVLLSPPLRLLYRSFDNCVGELREDFFSLAMAQHSMDYHYAKTTRGSKTPDFIMHINNQSIVIEVGGRGKGRTQFKGLDYEKKIVVYHQTAGKGKAIIPERGVRVPLHCLGFA